MYHLHCVFIVVEVWYSIQILTANEGNGGKLLSRDEIQPWPAMGLGE